MTTNPDPLLEHVLRNVLRQAAGSPLDLALAEGGIDDLGAMLTMTQEDIEYGNSVLEESMLMKKFGYHMLGD